MSDSTNTRGRKKRWAGAAAARGAMLTHLAYAPLGS
jgi:hypothetical protein